MELEQRLIICCNLKSHANNEKGQALALFEKDRETSKIYKLNSQKYFCEPNDCEIHIVPNNTNDNNYVKLEQEYSNRLYEINCVENKGLDDLPGLSKNKSNLHKIEPVEPRSICEIVDSLLPDETNPIIEVKSLPLTRHIFLREKDHTYGPFEYIVIESEGDGISIELKKPSDTKYLGITLQKLSILKFSNHDIAQNIESIRYPSKRIDGRPFEKDFIINTSDLRDISYENINYGFIDELAKAISVIVKETNTLGITSNHITMLTQRIKNKKSKFNFDTEYVERQMRESIRLEKAISSLNSEVRDALIKQLTKENSGVKDLYISALKNDEEIISNVQQAIKSEQAELIQQTNILKIDRDTAESKIRELKTEIEQLKTQTKEVNKEKENEVILQLQQKQTQLNSEIKDLEKIKLKYTEVIDLNSINEEIEKYKKSLHQERQRYDDKVAEIKDKEVQISTQKKELENIYKKQHDEYRKELLIVKNSIDALTQFDYSANRVKFECHNAETLLDLEEPDEAHTYIKYMQLFLSSENRIISIEQIINILICLDISFLTIFSGLPGTGKTSLVSLLGQKIFSSRFNNVQVGRGWSSERDLLGYFNPITNNFVSSSTGTYEFLEDMHLDKRLNIILLDEANLSPIEHYWSKFMGLSDSFIDRELCLSQSHRIKITPNLRFIATINNDMTTEPLSPRLLDRAPCIRLDIFNKYDDGNRFGLDSTEQEEKDRILEKYQDKAPTYTALSRIISSNALLYTDTEDQEYTAIFSTIETLKEHFQLEANIEKSFGQKVHLSERRSQLINKYLKLSLGLYKNFRANAGDWVENDKPTLFLDYAIAQFMLPLVNGNGKNFRNRINLIRDSILLAEQNCRGPLSISKNIINQIIRQGEEDLDTYDFMSLR